MNRTLTALALVGLSGAVVQAQSPTTGTLGFYRSPDIRGPNILVDSRPHATFNGADAQLDAAIAYLQKKIAEDPRPVPKAPAYPKRVFKYPPD